MLPVLVSFIMMMMMMMMMMIIIIIMIIIIFIIAWLILTDATSFYKKITIVNKFSYLGCATIKFLSV